MQSTTGCKINVSQATGADIEREIGLVGTRQAIEEAKTAIWDKVNSVVSMHTTTPKGSSNVVQKEKNGGGYGNRRGGRDNGNYNDSYSHQQHSGYDQSRGAAPAQGTAPVQGDASAADPYAPYGGYQNYLAMWYSSLAAQQQQPGGGQGQPPPGSA
jgi:far upstream element-binding protein